METVDFHLSANTPASPVTVSYAGLRQSLKLSDQQLQSFIELYQRKYGVVLEPQEALDRATRLLRLVEVVESNAYKTYNHIQNAKN